MKIGWAVFFLIVAAFNCSCVFTAWRRGDRLGSIGNAVLLPIMLAFAVGAVIG